MSNTSTDSFEFIAEDTMDLLVTALAALTSKDETAQLLARVVIGKEAADICTRAIALGAE